jgi:hypothetical protein
MRWRKKCGRAISCGSGNELCPFIVTKLFLKFGQILWSRFRMVPGFKMVQDLEI